MDNLHETAQKSSPLSAPPAQVAESNVEPSAADGKTPVLYSDPEVVASIIKKKIDNELDGLKPHPPNLVQKVLRVAAYPLALVIGYVFGRNEIQEQTQKYMTDNGHFGGIKNTLNDKSHIDEITNTMAAHEEEKSKIIKRILKMPEEKIEAKGFLKKALSNAERDMLSFKKILSPTAKTRVVFSSLFGLTASMGLLLTLSDNKNFLNFSRKHSNLDKDVALDR